MKQVNTAGLLSIYPTTYGFAELPVQSEAVGCILKWQTFSYGTYLTQSLFEGQITPKVNNTKKFFSEEFQPT